MDTRKQIVKKHEKRHQDLEKLFYLDKEITKEEFDRLHGENWDGLETALIEAGFIDEPIEPRDLGQDLDKLEERVRKLEPLYFPPSP